MRTYTIAGKKVTVQKNTLSINDKLNQRTTASFTVIEPDFEITKGMDVYIEQDGHVIFAGKVHKPRKNGDKIRYVSVSCVDFSQMIDKRVIAEVYENALAGDIVKDFIDKVFSQEGISEGVIQDGPVMSKAVFPYISGNAAMNELCDQTGYFWEVDKDKKLNFFERATYNAPFELTDSSCNYANLQVEEAADNYRNRQITRGPKAISSTQTREFAGDGKAQAFTVDLPIAKVPIIKVNGVPQTVGIRGLSADEDKHWHWQKEDKTISQNPSHEPLSATDTLTIEYQGYYPIIIVAENPGEIEARKTIEGGSGIYENVAYESNLDTQEASLQYTEGLLERYGFIPDIVTFNTYNHGLKSGQLISIQNTKHNIDGTYLIESVTCRDDDGLTLYTIKCLDGASVGGWERFYMELIKNSKKMVIRENEILVSLTTFRDNFIVPKMEDEMTYILHQYHICGQITCGTDVII
jgi:hypothetical protein